MMKWFPEYSNASQLNQELQRLLNNYREYLGYPVTILAGYSAGTGHIDKSEHYEVDDKGNPCSMAADIGSNVPLWWQLLCAERTGFENIGVYPAFNGLHVGIRGHEKRRWIGTGVDNSQTYIDYCIANLKPIMVS